jgi:hypothetical protein
MLMYGGNINTTKKHAEVLTEASEEVGLDIHTERTKYMLMSHHKKARQNHDEEDNRLYENVVKFKYFGMTTKSKFEKRGN